MTSDGNSSENIGRRIVRWFRDPVAPARHPWGDMPTWKALIILSVVIPLMTLLVCLVELSNRLRRSE